VAAKLSSSIPNLSPCKGTNIVDTITRRTTILLLPPSEHAGVSEGNLALAGLPPGRTAGPDAGDAAVPASLRDTPSPAVIAHAIRPGTRRARSQGGGPQQRRGAGLDDAEVAPGDQPGDAAGHGGAVQRLALAAAAAALNAGQAARRAAAARQEAARLPGDAQLVGGAAARAQLAATSPAAGAQIARAAACARIRPRGPAGPHRPQHPRAAAGTPENHLVTASEPVTVSACRLTISYRAGEDAVLTSACPGHGRSRT